MEYLLVHFPRDRRVWVDDEFNGHTEELIELEPGTNTVALGPPYNFTPAFRKVRLVDTTALTPREINFDLAE